MSGCDHHSFPEEREPSGRLILAPCLTCGIAAGDAIVELEAALDRARATAQKAIIGGEMVAAGAGLIQSHGEKMRAALAELVACKDLKDRLDAAFKSAHASLAQIGSMEEEYRRRKPLAWAAARALVQP